MTACTSTRWILPFRHACTLCGWLLPGPKSTAPTPPRAIAIAPAVRPLPYSFVWVELAGAHVQWRVVLFGLTPLPCDGDAVQLLNLESWDWLPAAELAVPAAVARAVTRAVFLTWPGAADRAALLGLTAAVAPPAPAEWTPAEYMPVEWTEPVDLLTWPGAVARAAVLELT